MFLLKRTDNDLYVTCRMTSNGLTVYATGNHNNAYTFDSSAEAIQWYNDLQVKPQGIFEAIEVITDINTITTEGLYNVLIDGKIELCFYWQGCDSLEIIHPA